MAKSLNIGNAPWPGIADKFTLTDTEVVDKLEIVPNSAKVTVAGKSYNADQSISINGQSTLSKGTINFVER